jgi:hypothetical protein
MSNRHKIDWITRTINFSKVFLGNNVNRVVYRRMLRHAPLKPSSTPALANQLYAQPLIPPGSDLPVRFWSRACANLRNDPK